MADLLYQAVLEKFTGEEFNETFDFEGFIPESNTVASRVVTATRMDGVDATAAVIVSSSISSDTVVVTIRTGSTETGYIIKVTVLSSTNTPAVQIKLLHVTSPGAYR
jgi:hypothetical protein